MGMKNMQVSSVTNFGRSGLSDWLIQRVSAVILLLYVVCHSAIILSTPEMSYAQWRDLFAGTTMRIFSLLTLLALCAHAWIGMWTVATDYLTRRMMGSKATLVRLVFLVGCIAVLAIYFIWGVIILWSV
jgi:succinate dehydrogenase / fumarate reductase membrane anchor subunit